MNDFNAADLVFKDLLVSYGTVGSAQVDADDRLDLVRFGVGLDHIFGYFN